MALARGSTCPNSAVAITSFVQTFVARSKSEESGVRNTVGYIKSASGEHKCSREGDVLA